MADERQRADEVEAGQRVYTPLMLRVYDLFVLGFSNRFVWRCRSSKMLERYDSHVGARHLDVGVGTGWFLDHCRWPVESPQITLLDLNENSLSAASDRIRRYAPATAQANVLEPVDLGDARFDSIGANFLFHCLPGGLEWKAATVASNLRPYLASGSVLFGSTILGRGVAHNLLGRRLMRLYNRKGNLKPRGRPAGTRARACVRTDRRRDRGRRRRGALRCSSVACSTLAAETSVRRFLPRASPVCALEDPVQPGLCNRGQVLICATGVRS